MLMESKLKTPAPFRFDGHGVNDNEGQRICKVQSCEPYNYGNGSPERNGEFDALSHLFAASAELYEALDLICRDYCPACGCDRHDTAGCNHCQLIQRGVEALDKASGKNIRLKFAATSEATV